VKSFGGQAKTRDRHGTPTSAVRKRFIHSANDAVAIAGSIHHDVPSEDSSRLAQMPAASSPGSAHHDVPGVEGLAQVPADVLSRLAQVSGVAAIENAALSF